MRGRVCVDVGNKLLIKSAFLCGKGGHFLVVERDAESFGYELTDLLTGRAVFSCNRNNNAFFEDFNATSFFSSVVEDFSDLRNGTVSAIATIIARRSAVGAAKRIASTPPNTAG